MANSSPCKFGFNFKMPVRIRPMLVSHYLQNFACNHTLCKIKNYAYLDTHCTLSHCQTCIKNTTFSAFTRRQTFIASKTKATTDVFSYVNC